MRVRLRICAGCGVEYAIKNTGVLKLAFSGQIELDRSKPDDVAFYNRLKAGKNAELEVGVFVAGPKNSHRRDSDGNVDAVDAVVQTKSLIVHSIELD